MKPAGAPLGAEIRLGCQGWTYPDWVGVFYPPGAKQEHLLPFYAEIFDTVELDNTFYRPPKPTLARSWARHTPPHFRFAAKVPREITHERGLAGTEEAMHGFARSLEPLGEKLGPVLVQLPASFVAGEETYESLERFLRSAPRELAIAVELRHESWHEERLYDLARAAGAAVAWTQWRTLPPVRAITADFLYLRWLGNRKDIEKYDRVQIDRRQEFEEWEREIRRAATAVEKVYGYFNNHWAGHSPASVNELLERLGREAIDPRMRWPQREIF